MTQIDISAVFYLSNPEVVLREEDEDGALLFNPDTNQVKLVNPTGLFIWKQCRDRCKFSSILEALSTACENVPEKQVSEDVQVFLEGMIQSGFMTIGN